MMDFNEELTLVADNIKDDGALMGSHWKKAEPEIIAAQTLKACGNNLKKHGIPFSFYSKTLNNYRNAPHVQFLIEQGMLTKSTLEADIKAPEGVLEYDFKPVILKCTPELVNYAKTLMGLS